MITETGSLEISITLQIQPCCMAGGGVPRVLLCDGSEWEETVLQLKEPLPMAFLLHRCPWLTKAISPAIPVYNGLVFLFVLANFSMATFMDPGVFPRGNRNGAVAGAGGSIENPSQRRCQVSKHISC